MPDYSSFFEANKTLWNKRTGIHKESNFYDLDSFKQGKSSLNTIEKEELGNVAGKTLLHLQCHFGMDTMSWEREGAIVTGIDLSDEAIRLANEIKTSLQLNAEFICCNVYDLPQYLDKKFDIVFTSYGTITWLPDLDKWAAIISSYLKPGGIFYMADFHPVLWMMDDDFKHIRYDYFNTQVIAEETSGTYADRNAAIQSKEYSWNHPLSEIFSALLSHKLVIRQFHEFPYSPYNCFKNMKQKQDGMWYIKGMDEKMPVTYSIKANKQPVDKLIVDLGMSN